MLKFGLDKTFYHEMFPTQFLTFVFHGNMLRKMSVDFKVGLLINFQIKSCI